MYNAFVKCNAPGSNSPKKLFDLLAVTLVSLV